MGDIKLENVDIINSINYIQDTPFVINLKVLYYILKCFINNTDLGSNGSTDIIFNMHNESNLFSDYKKNGNLAKMNEILRHNSIYNFTISNLSAALLLRNNIFYHPIFIDWRGRLYTSNSLLSFQSNQFTRSLISFSNGQKLNDLGVKALKIYIANCYGLDKKSYNFRLNWIEDNLNRILDIDNNMWLEAKEQTLFLASALELKGYYDNPETFISTLPIYLDATCNGLQHLASMTNDFNLAKFVNILESSRNEEPQDLYSSMIRNIQDKLDNIIISDSSYSNLDQLNLTREFIKRGIMTIPYGVTIRGIKDQLISDFFTKSNDKIKYTVTGTSQTINKVSALYKLNNKKHLKNQDNYDNFRLSGSEIMKLAKIIHSTLYDTYPSLTLLVQYLKSMNSLLMKLNLNIGIFWKTPSGLILEQKYMEMKSDTITVSILGKRKSFNLSKSTNKISLKRQNSAIVPNLIHSLDAANISLLIKSLLAEDKKMNLVSIHDCFASDANNIDLLHFNIRAAFLRIYQNNNFINDFHKFIIDYLINLGVYVFDNETKILLGNRKIIDIPKKPDFNQSFNLNYNLMKSQYFVN